MHFNGIIIKRRTECSYRGLDSCAREVGENWYLCDDDAEFEEYYDEHIGLTYYNIEDGSRVSACTDTDFIKRYCEESKKRGIPYRLLLVESDIPEPDMDDPPKDRVFLGYDYAYTGGDYYSAVYEEVPIVFPHLKLNGNGLFGTIEEMNAYLAEREEFVRTHTPLTLEVGDFAVFGVWEIKE